MNRTYESGSVVVTWGENDLSNGWADETFLTIEPINERVTVTFGADGQATPSKMAGKGATITLTLKQTAPQNQVIANLYALQDIIGADIEIAPFKVIDQVGQSAHFLALNAMLTEVPGHSFGATAGEKSWVWICESYFETEDPSTITSALENYIKA